MKILVVKPMEVPEVMEIDEILEAMQNVVGVLIQAIYPFDEDIALVCHEEGKLQNLPLNRALYDSTGRIFDVVSGTFFLCQAPAGSENFESLTEEQIKKYKEKYSKIEIWIK